MDELYSESMYIPQELLDEIQTNIERIISNFNVPTDNKLDVIKKINFLCSRSKYLTITDELTGMYNRRHFENTFEREFMRSKRYGSKLSIAIIDIDLFKKINDTYGHLAGDYILSEVGFMISDNFRKTDMAFRYGGEEFVVILTETDANQAFIPLERLRKSIEENSFEKDGKNIKVTISIGISSDIEGSDTTDEFFEKADKALYEAKNSGRNKTVILS